MLHPPYVPTQNDVGSDIGIMAIWTGGTNGLVVSDRALPHLERLLSYPNGVAYVVVVDDYYPEEISRLMNNWYDIKVIIPWLHRWARKEYLTILKMKTTQKDIHRNDMLFLHRRPHRIISGEGAFFNCL
ncbi:hypothetical protein ACHAXA_007466 [Cyclostephanos tholiformis]|uniref:Uncharacterized protein n=1 Tax=Cyclostephanos tholiformis TaxID=382380 RepID=A0ABD3RSA2_9STRA